MGFLNNQNSMQKQPKNTRVKCGTNLKLLYRFKTILFSQRIPVDVNHEKITGWPNKFEPRTWKY